MGMNEQGSTSCQTKNVNDGSLDDPGEGSRMKTESKAVHQNSAVAKKIIFLKNLSKHLKSCSNLTQAPSLKAVYNNH